MKQFTILVDIDDTLIWTVRTLVTVLNYKHNLDVKYEDVKEWDLTKAFPTLTKEQIFEPMFHTGFWDCVIPRDDAIQYLPKLIEDGHKIYICSASHYGNIREKIDDCLFIHFPYLSNRQLMIVHNKQMINADILIDDGVHNLTNAPYFGILMTTPYNNHIDEKTLGDNILRVSNWHEVYTFIKEKAE